MLGSFGQFVFVGSCGALAGWLVSAELAEQRCQIKCLVQDMGNLKKGLKKTVKVKLVKTKPKRKEVYTKPELSKENETMIKKLHHELSYF